MQVSLRSRRVEKEGGTPFPHELKWEEDMKSHLHNGFLVRGPAKTDSREVSFFPGLGRGQGWVSWASILQTQAGGAVRC